MGKASLPVDPGGNMGEGTGRHQLEKVGHAGAGSVPRGVPCEFLCMADVVVTPKGGKQVLQSNFSSIGPVEGHHWYHLPAANLINMLP